MKHSADEEQWHLYIVECRDGSLYTGITNDLNRRIAAHNEGTGARFTRGRRPVRLIYTEILPDRSAATKRELQIKKLSRAEKLQMISTG